MDYFDTVIPVLLSFSISVILCPIVIPFLKWLKFGQYVRDDETQKPSEKGRNAYNGRTDHIDLCRCDILALSA